MPKGGSDFEMYPLGIEVMNFQRKNVSNAFVFSVNDCCQDVPGLPKVSRLVVVDPAKGDGDEKGEYEHGDGNLLIVNSSYPTRKTLVSDRVTFALFEKLEEYEKRKGCLKLPNALKLFNHKNKTLMK